MARKITIKDGEIRTEGYSQSDAKSRIECNDFVLALDQHIEKAERKHPVFTNKVVCGEWSPHREMHKDALKKAVEFGLVAGNCDWQDVLSAEIIEASNALLRQDYAAAIDELMDCAAVIYRQIAVVREMARRENNEKEK